MWHNPTHQVLNKHLYYHVCSVYFSETHIWYVRIWQRFDEVFLNLLGGKFLTTHSLHPSGLKKNDTSNESSYCHVIIIIHYIIIYSLYIISFYNNISYLNVALLCQKGFIAINKLYIFTATVWPYKVIFDAFGLLFNYEFVVIVRSYFIPWD